MASKLPSIQEVFGGLKNTFQTKIAPLGNAYNKYKSSPFVQSYDKKINQPIYNATNSLLGKGANIPRFQFSRELIGNAIPATKTPVGQTVTNIALGIPESILNIPRNLTVGYSRLQKENLGAIRQASTGQKIKPNWTNVAAGVAPLAEAGLDLASFGVTSSIAKQGGKELLKGGVRQAFKQGAKSGALYGGAGGLAYGVGEQYGKKFNLGEVAGTTLMGVSLGGLLGGSISSLGALKRLTQYDDEVLSGLRNFKGQWKAGQKLVKPPKMPQAQWDFQLKFNKTWNRNPYEPVFQKDLQQAIKIEAERRAPALQIRDINKDKIRGTQSTGVGLYDVKAPAEKWASYNKILDQGQDLMNTKNPVWEKSRDKIILDQVIAGNKKVGYPDSTLFTKEFVQGAKKAGLVVDDLNGYPIVAKSKADIQAYKQIPSNLIGTQAEYNLIGIEPKNVAQQPLGGVRANVAVPEAKIIPEDVKPKFPGQTIKKPEDIEKILAQHEKNVKIVRPEDISKQEGQVKLTEAIMGDEDNQFKGIFNKWVGQRDVAGTSGAEAGIDFTNIPKNKAEEFINHAEGVSPSKDPEIIARATDWKQKTDALYKDLQAVAKKEGVDLGYIDKYVTHFWKETPQQVQQMMSAKGRNFGSRGVPTYAEGKAMGLTPKYTNPAEIMSEYVSKIEKTKANIGLFKEMKERGLIVPASVGRNTPGFAPVNAPGFPRSTTSYQGKVFDGSYYAPEAIAREINRMFSPEDFGRTGKIFSRAAKISKGTQDVVLSGGIPKTPVNAFTAAQMVKEFTSGSFVRPFKALVVSLSPNKALNYFKANAGQIKKMQARNVTVRSTFETESLMGGGSTWDKLVSTPTFKRFMPSLQIELFNNIEKRALGRGKSANEAADIAAKAVQNFYGLSNTGDIARRSQLGKDIVSTVAFAPTYRESMINFWVNSLKALRHPLALENRQNIKFLMGAAITYGVMDQLNRALTGHPMSQNPKGKEDKLLIPVGDTTIGVPFLSSIATVPRGVYRIAKDALGLDFKAAGADTLRTFGSMLVKPAGEMILNEDYFGQEIVDPNASTVEKGKQTALYLFKSNNHPYIKAALEAKGTPIYQTLSKAMELPFRFYKSSSIANAPFWENYFEAKAKDEQFQELKYKDPDRAVQFYNENKAQLDSLDSLKDQVKAYYETGKDSKVLQDGGVIQADGHMAFKGTDGKFHLIDTDFDVPEPEYTGNELLDKKIKSEYVSKLSSLEKNVVTLFENGIITADQAEEALGGIKDLKDATKTKKAKKPKSTKLTAPKIGKVKMSSTLKNFKLSDIKIPEIKKPSLNVSKGGYTLRATPRIKAPVRLQNR